MGREALVAAAGRAPSDPGVYLFFGAQNDMLYVGTAGDLHRRLQQHAAAGPATSHLHARYELVCDVRWEVAIDEEAAAWREADLIYALRPPYNAETRRRPAYLCVDQSSGNHRFATSAEPLDGSPVYGCFPHLGKGVATRLGIACSDGYVAFLRLLWAASAAAGEMPSVITRSAPVTFTVDIDPTFQRPLHSLLSGAGAGLLGRLRERASARPAYMQPALQRDLAAARQFFRAGPQLVRARRLRHGLRAGPLTPDTYRALVAAEVRESVGNFALPTP